MKRELTLKLILRPRFPEKREIDLKADVTNLDLETVALAKLAMDVERILNEHLPQLRAHTSIDIKRAG